ncbi:hypothetical protein F5888DRAFT_1639060 [Russula emetica]|nr:hypothetical protein F5888DRAFT_1639060 [Russula emetica]
MELELYRKRSASDSDLSGSENDDSSDEEPKKTRIQKKAKLTIEVDEEVDDEQENVEVKVIDSEEPGEEKPEETRRGSAQKTNQGGDLEGHHCVEISVPLEVKKETTKDLLTVFSDLIVVKFKKNESYETVKGRWCLPCSIEPM